MPRNKRPNLLFVTTDHQRADSIRMTQAGMEVTPHLNQLLEESCHFTRAYTTCPLCVPARTALATGRYPTQVGVHYNDFAGCNSQDHRPLPEYLADAGYKLAHCGINHVRLNPPLQERTSWAKWIDIENYYDYCTERNVGHDPAQPNPKLRRIVKEWQNGKYADMPYSNAKSEVWPYEPEHFMDHYYMRESIDFISQEHREPFALFVNIWAPHPPLLVPEPFASQFPPDQLSLPANVGRPAEGEPHNRRQSVPAQLAEGISLDQWREVWAAHLGLVALADQAIGGILEALRAADSYENTVIVFTSDHGDHLGQHAMYQKMEMYESAVRVPLIVRLPNAPPQQMDHLVSHLDILPTLLDVLDVEGGHHLEGRVLTRAIAKGQDIDPKAVFCQFSGNYSPGYFRRAIVTKRFKYIYDPDDIAELYDLADDPLETKNLIHDSRYAAIVKKLHEDLSDFARTHEDPIDFTPNEER